MDLIITVCDNAAGETCPIWPGRPANAHWGIEDPAAVEGEAQVQAFLAARTYLQRRISLLLSLPDEELDTLEGKEKVRAIGRVEGATKNFAQPI